jgi:hypothetical protein
MSLQTATGVVGSDCTLNISMGVEMVWNSLRTGKGPLPGFGVEVLAGEYGRKRPAGERFRSWQGWRWAALSWRLAEEGEVWLWVPILCETRVGKDLAGGVR